MLIRFLRKIEFFSRYGWQQESFSFV